MAENNLQKMGLLLLTIQLKKLRGHETLTHTITGKRIEDKANQIENKNNKKTIDRRIQLKKRNKKNTSYPPCPDVE